MRISAENVAELSGLMFIAAAEPARWVDFLDRVHVMTGGVRPHLFGHDQLSDCTIGLISSG